jgi:hypothetical protein
MIVSAVTAEQMWEVDRIAVQEFGVEGELYLTDIGIPPELYTGCDCLLSRPSTLLRASSLGNDIGYI